MCLCFQVWDTLLDANVARKYGSNKSWKVHKAHLFLVKLLWWWSLDPITLMPKFCSFFSVLTLGCFLSPMIMEWCKGVCELYVCRTLKIASLLKTYQEALIKLLLSHVHTYIGFIFSSSLLWSSSVFWKPDLSVECYSPI